MFRKNNKKSHDSDGMLWAIFISDVEREKRESFAFAVPSRGANIGFNTPAFKLEIM